MLSKAILLVLCFLMFSCEPVFAAGKTTGARKAIVPTENKQESLNSYGLSYLGRTDLADQKEKKAYKHELDIGYSRKLNERYSLSFSTGLEASSIDNNVTKKEGNPAVKDLDTEISYSNKELIRQSIIGLAILHSLPTGYESRTEEYKSIIETKALIASKFFDHRMTVSNAVSFSYIFNTYKESPTTLSTNPDHMTKYGLEVAWALNKSWSIGLRGSAQSVHFIEADNELKTNTAQFITYSRDSFKVSLSNLIGTYDENDSPRLLYLDDTKQVIALGVSFEIN